MFTLKILFDVSPTLERMLKRQGDEIMAKLQDVIDATRLNGEAARAAIAEVANDFVAISTQVTALQQQITDMQAIIDAMPANAAEVTRLTALVADMEAGLDTVKSEIDATTAGLTGLNPVP